MQTYLKTIERAPADFITVIVPEEITEGLLGYLLRRRKLIQLKAGLAPRAQRRRHGRSRSSSRTAHRQASMPDR